VDDPNVYYVIGTAFAHPNEAEPTRGRILIFRVSAEQNGQRLILETEKEVKGAVYSLNAFNGKLLASINSKIQLFKWVDSGDEATGSHDLESDFGHHGHILALYVQSRGDFIIVGDLMKSISLLVYKPVDGSIEEIARDYNPQWMTAVDILDDDTYIGAENSFNLFTVRKNSDAATDDERGRLEIVGEYHLGELVNKFKHGSLVMKMPDESGNSLAAVPTLLYGTVNGVIGVIASLPQKEYLFLQRVQQNLSKVIKGVGGFTHEQWRSFSNERKTVESKNFLDGDLIESFLDLTRTKMEEVVKGLDITVEDLSKKIEELARLH
jgi:DNA damage-binding protein 1